MRKFVFLLLLLIAASSLFAQDFYVNGINEAQYVYKAAEDSLNSFFKDKFAFNLYYKNFVFGMKFIGYLPKYDNYKAAANLNSNDLYYDWTERYVSYTNDNMSVLAGKFEEVFGTGIVFRGYQDEDFDIDTRLNGLLFTSDVADFHLKTLYGALSNPDNLNKLNIAYGADLKKNIGQSFMIGASALTFRKLHQIDNLYTKIDIWGTKFAFYSDEFEYYGEYAGYTDKKAEIGSPDDGFAAYSNANLYLDKFTFTGAYKNYRDFDYGINDLPTVNHSGEPLSTAYANGHDEEGAMGEISFVPNSESEITVNYAESWNHDFSIRQNDIFSRLRHDFAKLSIIGEFSQTEQVDYNAKKWGKISTPHLSFDFVMGKVPLLLKTETEIHQVTKKLQNDEIVEDKYYEPLLQTDFDFSGVGLSLAASYHYSGWDDLMRNEVLLGAELNVEIFHDTNLKFFAGKEKGGKVCRNGTCRHQSKFNGLRLELTTSF